jgi:excinuclease ABC subunit C
MLFIGGGQIVKGLFQRERFAGFGPAALSLSPEPAALTVIRGRRAGVLREGVRKQAPRLPGVYGMLDAVGELIYVGKARSLRSRLMSYFRPKSRDEKAGKIVAETRRIVWERSPTEFGALLRELELIRRWQPRWNVQGKPKRMRRVYLCVGRAPAAYLFLAPKPTTRVQACFGPVAGMKRAREAVRRLNDWYRLRDCPQSQQMVFADQRELFPVLRTPGCIRHDIGSCIAPCAAACTQAEYAFHVGGVVDFLEGRDRTPIEQLERQMDEAAVGLEFERAALLRDRLKNLTWLQNHLVRVRESSRESFVYPVEGADGRALWYLIRAGVARAVILAPTEEGSRDEASALLAEVFTHEAAPGPVGVNEVDGLLLVSAWFRRHEQEKKLSIEEARRTTRREEFV